MKRKNVIASVAGIVLSVITVFTSVGTVKAEEGTVTERLPISMQFENEVGEKKIADEDAKVINEAFGYEIGDSTVMVCSEDTTAYINWEESVYERRNVYATQVLCPKLSRDENGKLVIEQDENGLVYSYNGLAAWADESERADPTMDGSFFNVEKAEGTWLEYVKEYQINEHMGLTNFWVKEERGKPYVQKPITDVYIVRVDYIANGMGASDYWYTEKSEEMTFGYMDFWVLPEGVSTVLKLEDVNEPDDNKPSDTYILDLSSDNAVVSSETFNILLEENKTKDIVIKSNNEVTFTFAKGTMKPVEGKDSYDFSTTINSIYNTDLPSYVTSNNFISQINYNYSGKLPAEASIRFYAGTQYSGKTLYYYLLNEDKTFAEVQSIVVDDLGYVTVRQDHCSSYLLTSEEPKIQDSTNNTETSGTIEDKTSPVTGDNTSNKETPATGDNSMMLLYLLAGVSAMGMIVVSKKVKTVKNS